MIIRVDEKKKKKFSTLSTTQQTPITNISGHLFFRENIFSLTTKGRGVGIKGRVGGQFGEIEEEGYGREKEWSISIVISERPRFLHTKAHITKMRSTCPRLCLCVRLSVPNALFLSVPAAVK